MQILTKSTGRGLVQVTARRGDCSRAHDDSDDACAVKLQLEYLMTCGPACYLELPYSSSS